MNADQDHWERILEAEGFPAELGPIFRNDPRLKIHPETRVQVVVHTRRGHDGRIRSGWALNLARPTDPDNDIEALMMEIPGTEPDTRPATTLPPAVAAAFAALTDEQRDVLEAGIMAGLSTAKGGDMIGRSKSRFHELQKQALDQLRAALNKGEPDAET